MHRQRGPSVFPAMTRQSFVRAYRLAGAVLIASALIYILVDRGDSPTFSVSNFFSYFTVLSNLLAAVVLVIGGRNDMLRGGAVLYMGMTGLVYALLLSDIDVQTPGFSNWVLHRVMPVVMVLDWLLEPPRVPLAFRRTLAWLAFPLLYLPYTLIRGEIVDWYPYPFMDPTRDGGYLRVAGNCVGVAVGFVALTWLITWVGNRLGGHDAATAVSTTP